MYLLCVKHHVKYTHLHNIYMDINKRLDWLEFTSAFESTVNINTNTQHQQSERVHVGCDKSLQEGLKAEQEPGRSRKK